MNHPLVRRPSFLSVLFVGALASSVSAAVAAPKIFMPPNDLHLQDDVHRDANITEKLFNETIDHAVGIWQPLAKLHGATLTANKLWTNGTVNASAEQRGNDWIINMYGGLARRPEITLQGFALVVCHELGHHFAGHFFYDNSPSSSNGWASGEGESDYFATHVCAKEIFKKTTSWNRSIRQQPMPPVVRESCNRVYADPAAQDLCYQTAAGGHSLARLLAGGGAAPKFETPDPKVVTKTNVNHPAAQCRLDTYFHGALCPTPFDLKVIPARRFAAGQNSQDAEKLALQVSCGKATGFSAGIRPACWFKSQL